jgi:molecular chaperone HtpG
VIEIGVNIVEIVTKGLYTNSLDIFREYIQNSCDAIDDAVDAGILQENDGKIEIDINADARRITIKDNGMGIPKRYFEKTMSKIGNSDKTLETDRGFRGIGRLCGLAYCREARFLSTAKGETKLSIMTINAEGLRKEFFSDNKHSAESVLRDVMKYDGEGTEEVDEHFFCVELIDIVGTNNILLDVDKVREYLSFVAPVDYKQSLGFKGLQNKILEHATELNFKISSYNIFVNGEHLSKPYKSNFRTTHNGADEVFDLEFRDFRDDDGKLIAWSWIGLSNFKGVIDQTNGTLDNMMRGIRLRAGNIQIGDAEALKNLFSEARGTNYFIGEVHTVDTNLIPNSRRDYFEENEACNVFEAKLKKYFAELYKIYHTASEIRSSYRAIAVPSEVEHEFTNQSVTYQKSHRMEHEAELARLKKNAKKAESKLTEIRQKAEQSPVTLLARVVFHMTERPSVNISSPARSTDKPIEAPTFPPSTWSRDLRKLYTAIETVILDNPKLSGKILLDKIKTELAK